MSNIHIPRTRAAMAVWASIGLVGTAVAFYSVVSLAGSSGVLPWPTAHAAVGQLIVRFIVGISLSCLSLWGIYKRTIHGREDIPA